MGYKIRFQRRALNDLERLVRFIALGDSAAATRFGYALVQAVENLGECSRSRTCLRPGTRYPVPSFSALPHLLPCKRQDAGSFETLARRETAKAEVVRECFSLGHA